MIPQSADGGDAEGCAFCGRPIDVVRYRLRPGSGPHGDPSDLEPVPFCSEDWQYLSEGQLPPRRPGPTHGGPPAGSALGRVGFLAGAALSAALVILVVWLLATRVLA